MDFPQNNLFEAVFEVFVDPYMTLLIKEVGDLSRGYLIWPVESDLGHQFFFAVNPYTRKVYELNSKTQNPAEGIELKNKEDMVWILDTLSSLIDNLTIEDNADLEYYLPLDHLVGFLTPCLDIEIFRNMMVDGGAEFTNGTLVWPVYFFSEENPEEDGDLGTEWYSIDLLSKTIYELQYPEQSTKYAMIVEDEDVIENLIIDITSYIAGFMLPEIFEFQSINPANFDLKKYFSEN